MRLQDCAMQGLYRGQMLQKISSCGGALQLRKQKSMSAAQFGPLMYVSSLLPSQLHLPSSSPVTLPQAKVVSGSLSDAVVNFSSPSTSYGSMCPCYQTLLHSLTNWRRFCSYSACPSRSRGNFSFSVFPATETTTALDDEATAGGSSSSDLASYELELWSALKERRTEDAWQALKVMRRKKIMPSGVCFSRMLAQLCHQGSSLSLTRAQKVMADLQQQDQLGLLDKDSLGLLALVSAKGGAARYALRVVRFMIRRKTYPSVKIWSAVISRLGKSMEDSTLALEVFDEICGLMAAGGAMDPQFSGDTSCMRPDTGAYNAALNACATAGMVEKGMVLFEQMRAWKLFPDLLTFNILIKLYARAEQRDQLQKVLELMEQAGVEPDASTLNSLVAAFVGLGDIDEAERLVKSLRSSDTDGREEGKAGLKQRGEILLQTCEADAEVPGDEGGRVMTKEQGDETSGSRWIRNLEVKPDARTYTTLMKGYVESGRLKDAIQMLVAMQNRGDPETVPNEVTYTTAMSALIKLGMLDEARSILKEMSSQNVAANVVTYNTLLHGFCASQKLDTAFALSEDMSKVGIELDVVSYNILINGCIKADDNAKALEVFQKMRESGILPSAITYTTLITAFGKNSQPKLAAKVFEEMRKDERIRVDAIAWNAYIDAFCKVGDTVNAKAAFLKMKEAGVHPTVPTYAMLVQAYGASDNHQSGEVLVLWKEIYQRMEAGQGGDIVALKPDEGLLNCLVDACVRAGFFQKAIEVVACIERHGIPANKAKYKRMFIELYSNLYTGKHASQRRRDKSKDRRRAVEAFKFWVGLPNNYYESDWSPLTKSDLSD